MECASLYTFEVMASNSLGNIFKLSTFGESHGEAIGAVLDGCPAGLVVDMQRIQDELDRRKPGQSHISTQRKESDQIQILSGLFEGKTTGSPIAFLIQNVDQRSKDYRHIKDTFRPSHADFTFQEKYGIRDYRGGGRSSARVTAPIVAAGALAAQFLENQGVYISTWVSRVHDLSLDKKGHWSRDQIESNILRCPDSQMAEQMIKRIEEIKKAGDTVGGAISCSIIGTPIGWGEPVFEKLNANLAKAMMGINAVKAIEIGSGLQGTFRKGSEENDLLESKEGEIHTKTNNSGGIQGGISNGEEIFFKVAFKPVATIMQDQGSVDKDGNAVTVQGKGRHDPCVVPRAVPIVEALAALVLADFSLMARSSRC
jgi:chorismate synthase